jgi:hypothetical protein
MNMHKYLLAALATLVALGLSTQTFAADVVTEAQIASARTPADHEAIAQAYEAEAAVAESTAQGHDKMAQTYRIGGAPKGSSAAMASHCDRLATSYRTAATEYRALASEHRKLATAATK